LDLILSEKTSLGILEKLPQREGEQKLIPNLAMRRKRPQIGYQLSIYSLAMVYKIRFHGDHNDIKRSVKA
jgi:hypothetical protein